MTTVEVNPGPIPDELKDRDQWLLWDANNDTPRQPHWAGDFAISWSDPEDWHSFDAAVDHASRIDSWGIGYVMAGDNPDHARGLYGCLDLDGVLGDGDETADWLPPLERFVEDGAYIERSPSGDGLHIPLIGQPAPDWWADSHLSADEHEGVEYLRHKFCTFTGDIFRADKLQPDGVAETNPAPFLYDAYEALNGEPPRLDAETDDSHGDREWTEDDVQELLDHISSACSYPQWRNILFAVHDWDDGHTGKALAESWSRGSGWDDQSQRLIDAIWDGAEPGNGVTLGTLVHHAKEGGWEPSRTEQQTPDRPQQPDSEDADGEDDGDAVADLSPQAVGRRAGLGEDGSISDLDDREKAACVWDLIRDTEEVHVRVRRDNGSLWAYDDGVWKPEGQRALRHAARQALGSMNYGANVLSELEAQARSDPAVELEAGDFGVAPGTVAVDNGLLSLPKATGGDEDAIRPLEPGDHAVSKLPVEYDPDVESDEWRTFVRQVVEREKHDAVQEYVGYCLHRGAMPHSKAMLLVGSGSNGKTTFLNVIRGLLGEEHTTSKPVHKFDEDNHVADLYGVLANIDADLSEGSLSEKGIATFKRLVGGDTVDARKLYEDAFSFKPTAKHLYACNQVPDVSAYVADHDTAFWRRWIVVEFPNYFPPDARDPELGDRLMTPSVLSAVLNWAIKGWARLRDQGGFSGIESHEETRQLWQSWGESVDAFIADCVERDVDAERMTTTEAYDRYRAWCRQVGADYVGQRRFTDTLKMEDVEYSDSIRVNGKVRRGYEALGLSDEVPEPEDTSSAEADESQGDTGPGSQSSLTD